MTVNRLFEFIKNSPTAYHATDSVTGILLSEGFTELYEGDKWALTVGGKYFVRRNKSSIIAFVYREGDVGFNIVASHSDSPAFRVKMSDTTVGAYSRLEVERYGGMIYYTWLDRPLSVAGRLVVEAENGVSIKLVDMDCDSLVIPSVAIHMNREANDGLKLNPARDLLPLYSVGGEKGDFMKSVAALAGTTPDKVLSHDLFLYCREEPKRVGKDGELILCPRLDDLACVFTSTIAFTEAEDAELIPTLAVFDNEEVGSETKQGAASGFLYETLLRVSGSEETLLRRLSRSFMVSADNAHALHPNRPDLADPDNAPLLNRGVVIKYNANQRYATDGVSDAIFRTVCTRAGAPYQTYCNRADMPGGSTLGSISDTRLSVPTVDIGLPQLAMHSAVETAGTADLDSMVKALRKFYETPISMRGSDITI